jgi:hypothetical protein
MVCPTERLSRQLSQSPAPPVTAPDGNQASGPGESVTTAVSEEAGVGWVR